MKIQKDDDAKDHILFIFKFGSQTAYLIDVVGEERIISFVFFFSLFFVYYNRVVSESNHIHRLKANNQHKLGAFLSAHISIFALPPIVYAKFIELHLLLPTDGIGLMQ